MITAYADQLGLVGLIKHYVPTEMDIDAGTVVLGLVLDTLSDRSPLDRSEECFAHPDTELLLGKPLPPQACTDDPVGRVLDGLYDFGTMKLLTACAVRAGGRFGWECVGQDAQDDAVIRDRLDAGSSGCVPWGLY